MAHPAPAEGSAEARLAALLLLPAVYPGDIHGSAGDGRVDAGSLLGFGVG